METSLSGIPHDNAWLFQEEIGDFASIWFSTRAELDLKVLPLMDQNAFINRSNETWSAWRAKGDVRPHESYINTDWVICMWGSQNDGKRLTNLLELLFRRVLALPKASSSGLDCRMMSLTCCESRVIAVSDLTGSYTNISALTHTRETVSKIFVICVRYK